MTSGREAFSLLWKKVKGWSRFFYPYRRLRFTREGWLFSLLSLSIGLIAVNTGHNLFYLVFGLLLGMVIVSGMLSERVLRGIRVERHLPAEVTARIPFAVVLEVKNPHSNRISYSLNVRDGASFHPRQTLGYIPSLPPGESRVFHYLAQVERRGCYQFGPVQLVTRFPFGLFEKIRIIPLRQSFIAYPGDRETSSIRALASGREQIGNKKCRWGEEILGLRPADLEDDHRLIHWRTTARMGQLMVKEFVEETEQPRPVFFDNRGKDGEGFEQAVEVAASLLRLLVGRGVPITFSTWENHIESSAVDRKMEEGLRLLALVAPSSGSTTDGFDKWCNDTIKEGGGIFLQGEVLSTPALPPCEVVHI